MSKQNPPVGYPVAPLHVYPPPWPSGGGNAVALGIIQNGNLVILPFGMKPVVLPTMNYPPSGALFFRFIVGAQARQIQTSSYACRKVIAFAPGPTADSPNLKSVYMGLQGLGVAGVTSMEIPPGGAATIDISDASLIYFIGQNATDIITGWAESVL